MGPYFVDRLQAQARLRTAALQYHIVPGGARFVPAGFKNNQARIALFGVGAEGGHCSTTLSRAALAGCRRASTTTRRGAWG